jgi:uroporphyrinogen-III decarboxylase
VFAPFREAGLPIILHSDGQIHHPARSDRDQPHRIERSTGGDGSSLAADPIRRRAAFYGGVSTQSVLPHGTPGEVKAAVRDCARSLAPDGTGLVIGPSHRMMTDIPLENVMAMLEALDEL